MATKKTTPKEAAKPKTTAKKTPAKAAPKEAPKVEACPAPTVSALSSEDLAKFLALPKGYDSKEVSLVLQAATDYANEYIGKTPNPTVATFPLVCNVLTTKLVDIRKFIQRHK